MAHHCPRCGYPLKRATSDMANIAGGLIGAMLYAALGSYECKNCGKIPKNEFPKEIRRKMFFSTLLILFGAIGILIVVCWLLSTM